MANPRRINVPAERLGKIFNESGYWELAKQGTLLEKV